MLKRLFFVFLLVVVVGTALGYAQTPTTQGTEFWASFMRNGYKSNSYLDNYTLIASAKHACTVTVSNPNTGWSDQFTVRDNGVSTYSVNPAQGYNDQKGGKAFKGLYVSSTDTISLYIANEAENSYDAANVLPASALGSQYMLQSYKAMGDQSSHYGDSRASFLVLATEDNTEVQITPSCLTFDNHAAGQPYTISLSRGECYHVLNMNAGSSMNSDGDFSGTTVVSADNKPIAVFNGNSITSVPGGLSTGYDHIFEQAMPTNYWGKRFVVTSTRCPSNMNLSPDQIKVIALFDNTTVTRNGSTLFHLNAGESDSFEMNLVNDPCTYLEADNPIAVFLYQHSHGNSNPAYGDPSMVWISPVEQTVYEVTFSTFEVQEVEVHFVNIVCYTENVADMTLDGQDISMSFAQVPGFPEFSYARIQLNHAAHTIRCPRGFVAHVYGIGQAEGYAYSVGSSAKTLTKQLYVDDILSTDLPDGYSVCQDNPPIQFRVEFNYDFDHVSWNFGDGSSDEGAEVTHAFPVVDDYDVEAVVYRNLYNQVQPFDTLAVAIHVRPLYEVDVTDATCDDTYRFHGIDWPVPYFDDYQVDGDDGCDTIFHLNLSKNPSVSAEPLYETICEGEGIMWFDTLRTEPRTYLVISHTTHGCDSVCLLILSVATTPENPERAVTSCDEFHWGDDLVCDHTDDYSRAFTTPEGCEYDSILHYTRMDSPPFEEIRGLSNVAVSTNFWPGEYIFCIDDSTGMDTGTLRWELLDNPEGPGQWELKPHGASCTVIAYSIGERTLWVSSGDGPCDREAYKTINCSGYAIDENESAPLEIYPNPARKELMVKGPEIIGVTLYNLLGHKVKEVVAYGDDQVRVAVDDLPQALYLLEVRHKKGNNTRLVSVIK